MAADNAPQAVLLAAGKGTRMAAGHSSDEVLPKVLYPVADEPMIRWVVRACHEAGVARCVVVVGYKGARVREALGDLPGCVFVEQREQLGTGHATRAAEPLLKDQPGSDVFVLAGDGPMVRPRTLRRLLEAHHASFAAATLATGVLEDPTGYGRVLRTPDGGFDRIVEQKDATPRERAMREINTSCYCFRVGPLFQALAQITNANRQGEYYLTDVPRLLRERGEQVSVVEAASPEDVLGVNTPEQLEKVDRLLRARLAREEATA